MNLDGIERVVIWFSAGVTSAVSAQIVVEKFSGALPIKLVNCDTGSEDEDNYRFMDDVADWLGLDLEVISSEKYGSTFDVYKSARFFKNQYGARCTLELKKLPRRDYENLRTDLQVFGYDSGEQDRANRFNSNNPEVRTYFPLIEMGLTKNAAREILLLAGIREPRTYAEGFHNANCLSAGCIKGAKGYWNHIRKMRPDVFSRMAVLEREIGYSINTSTKAGVRSPMFLDELPPTAGNYSEEPPIQCGLFCGEI